MKYKVFSSLILVAILSISLTAQVRPGGSGSGGTRGPRSADPRTEGPDVFSRVLNISGKVVLDNGSPLAERVLIESNCKGTTKTEGYTDSKGSFTIQFGGNTRNRGFSETGMASDSNASVNIPGDTRRNDSGDWRDCELRAILSGFISQVVDLRSRGSAFGHVDVGNIALHRIAAVEGSTVSVKEAQIPDVAKREYEKGLEEKKNGKLDAAQQRFKKAVEDYPQFAWAWVELGRVQAQTRDLVSARESFRHSIAADPNLMAPYRELTQLAAHDQKWQEVADNTDKLLKLNSQNFPEFWLFNCVAKYYLGNLDAAESSALQGIKIDTGHRIPKTEYVLGIILAQKHDYPGAVEHLHKYLGLSPNGPDAPDANKKLEQVQHFLDAAASSSKQ
jgi:TolA-binding protein